MILSLKVDRPDPFFSMKYQLAILSFIFVAISLARAAPVSHEEIVKNSSNGLHLLQFTEDGESIWKTEEEEFELKRKGVNFVITNIFIIVICSFSF